jgi:hypothetical protein
VGDRDITRDRVQADLAVLSDYQAKYRGMIEACHQQLQWDARKYASLPHPPELLRFEAIPPFWSSLVTGLPPLVFAAVPLFLMVVWWIGVPVMKWRVGWGDEWRITNTRDPSFAVPYFTVFLLIIVIAATIFWFLGPSRFYKLRAAAGDAPLRNILRQQAYEKVVAAALDAGSLRKTAEDYHLRCRIRDLEGLSKTVAEKEAVVRQLLAKLERA